MGDETLKPEDVTGWLGTEEGERLETLAAYVPPEQAIVEIGALRGRSTCFMARGSTGAGVYSIDSWDRDDGAFEDYLANVKACGYSTFFRRQPSLEAARTWTLPIGLLFIDASHDYANVRADYEAWHGFVAPGGWVAFHDCSPQFPGVRRVVGEIVIPSGLWQTAPKVQSLWTGRRL